MITFVIACYNNADTLEECIGSVLKSGHFHSDNCEIIVVNDGSTDDTLLVCGELQSLFPLKIITVDKIGVGGAKNVGLRQACGSYIMFLDADDTIDPFSVYASWKQAVYLKLDIMITRLRVYRLNGQNEIMRVHSGPFDNVCSGKDILINGYQPSSICPWIISKKFVEDNELSIFDGTQMDVEFSTKALLAANRVLASRTVTYNYIRRYGSITTTRSINEIQNYLHDAYRIAIIRKQEIDICNDYELCKVLKRNNANLVWNLVFRLYNERNRYEPLFTGSILRQLKQASVLPRGKDLSTWKQRVLWSLLYLWINKKYK